MVKGIQFLQGLWKLHPWFLKKNNLYNLDNFTGQLTNIYLTGMAIEDSMAAKLVLDLHRGDKKDA